MNNEIARILAVFAARLSSIKINDPLAVPAQSSVGVRCWYHTHDAYCHLVILCEREFGLRVNVHVAASVATSLIVILYLCLTLLSLVISRSFTMEDTHSVSTLIDSTTSKIHQLHKAFAELEGHRAVTLNVKWKELEEHFHGLEKSLKRRFHELENQEKEFENRTVEAQKILEKRQAAVAAKEEASLETLQEKRDAAMYAITTAREKQRKVSTKESSVVTDGRQGGPPTVEEKPPDVMVSDSSVETEEMKNPNNGSIEVNQVMSYPQLVKFCEQMDSEGLHKFISDNRKNLAAIREEIPLAFRAAANPALFVLESLEDFYRLELPTMDAKKDSNLLGVRRTCIMLMECPELITNKPRVNLCF